MRTCRSKGSLPSTSPRANEEPSWWWWRCCCCIPSASSLDAPPTIDPAADGGRGGPVVGAGRAQGEGYGPVVVVAAGAAAAAAAGGEAGRGAAASSGLVMLGS